MPTNTLIDSMLNPVQFYKQVPDEDPRFLTKDMDDWYFGDTIREWEERVCWNQPFQTSDVIHLQLQSTYGPINLRIHRRSDDAIIDTIPYEQGAESENQPGMFIYEIDVDMSIYPAGEYYFTRTFGTPVVLMQQSENIELSVRNENTLYLEYKHFQFREDMVFETGIFPGIRIPGMKKFKNPASKDTVYEDQVLNMETLRSVPFRIWTLLMGAGEGIPDYLADKLNRILGCSTLLIDGKEYTKAEGAEMEVIEIEDYPMRAWKVDMREKRNRASRIYEDETAQNATVAVMISVDSKGFGADQGGNETVVQDVD